MKRWVPNPCEECEEHGAAVEIYTSAEQTNPNGAFAYDGDECRCSDGCTGWMTADGPVFYCNWHEPTSPGTHHHTDARPNHVRRADDAMWRYSEQHERARI